MGEFWTLWGVSWLMHATVVWGVLAVISLRLSFEPASEARLWRLGWWGSALSAAVCCLPGLQTLSAAPALVVFEAESITASAAASQGMASAATAWPWWLIGWAVVALVLVLRYVARVYGDARLLSRREALSSAHELSIVLRELEVHTRLSRPVRLSVSDDIASPCALGRGEICLPTHMLDAPVEGVESALAHELSHLERRDPLWRHVDAVASAALWFHPLSHVATRRLQRLAEWACDDRAVSLTRDPRGLARQILSVARRLLGPRPRLAPAMAGSKRGLEVRVRRLVEHAQRPPARRLGWRGWSLGCALLLGLAWGLPVAQAASSSALIEDSEAKNVPGPAGQLDRNIIRSTITAERRAVASCYEAALAQHPNLSGRLELAFTITPEGRVVGLSSSGFENVPELGACIQQEARSWRFPKPKGGGIVRVRYPFVFSPG